MNYFALIKGLIKEAIPMKQYSKIKKPFDILAYIAMIPVIISAFFSVVGFLCMSFLYQAASAGVDFLEKWVDKKKEGINHATEAVLFFVTMPTIFSFNVLLSFFAVFFFLSWFNLQINVFLATLGGTRWQPFIMSATFDEENDLEPKTNELSAKNFSISIFVCQVVFILSMILAPALEMEILFALGFLALLAYNIYVLLIPFVFKKGPVVVEEATVDYTIAEEPVFESVSAYKDAGTEADTQADEETF